MNTAAEIYKKDHPDVDINVTEVPWDDVQAKLTTLAQSQQFDQLPDIVLVQNMAFQKNVINYPDLFSDYSDSGIDFSEFPEAVVGYSVVDGVNYGLPFDSGTAVNALRTDVLEEAGYSLDDFTDITWSDFIKKGEDVLAKTGKPMMSGVAGSSDTLMMILQSAGVSLFSEDGKANIVNNDALRKAIDIYAEMVKKGLLVEVNSWDEYIGTITNSTAAGTLQGIWISGSIQTSEDQSGKWGITNVPKLEGVEGATNYSTNGGSSWAITSNANVELAADFLKSTFAGSTELYDTILSSSGAIANWIPAGKSDVYNQPVEFYGNDPVYKKVVEFGSHVPAIDPGVYYYEARDAVSAAVTKIIAGGSPDEALQEAQDNVEFAMQ
ncbi:MAG: extracellular solute-binding protein [Actinomycetaceae bacterium]|nr:extracellular solute-binding protein [Actinomycetaceae bacterium]MBS6364992.1 extracellular solute-binding protein [Actinomycetaceae bacterium]